MHSYQSDDVIVSCFPEVPTIRLIGFPYASHRKDVECGTRVFLFGRGPLGQGGLIGSRLTLVGK